MIQESTALKTAIGSDPDLPALNFPSGSSTIAASDNLLKSPVSVPLSATELPSRTSLVATAEPAWRTQGWLKLPHDWEFFPDRRKMSAEDLAAFERVAFMHGAAPDSYLAVEPDGQAMMTADRQMGFGILNCGRVWHLPGGVLASAETKREFLKTLAEVARRNRLVIGVHSVNESDAQIMREVGFEINKFGEEPTLDLTKHTWSGNQLSWVRQQSNNCQREGIVCKELHRSEMSDEQWRDLETQLKKITADDLKDRGVPELRGLEGRLFLDHLGRRRVFIAYHDAQKSPPGAANTTLRPSGLPEIQAFLICNPMNRGTAWAFEMYRRQKNAVRGVMPHLMRSTVDLLKAEGIGRVSLCTVPGKGSGVGADPRQHWLVGRTMNFWYEKLNFMFNLHGQCHYKSRFRPTFENRYLCVTPHSTMFSIFSFLIVTGASIRPINGLKQWIRQMRNPSPKVSKCDPAAAES